MCVVLGLVCWVASVGSPNRQCLLIFELSALRRWLYLSSFCTIDYRRIRLTAKLIWLHPTARMMIDYWCQAAMRMQYRYQQFVCACIAAVTWQLAAVQHHHRKSEAWGIRACCRATV
jgi:hypothetical protein